MASLSTCAEFRCVAADRSGTRDSAADLSAPTPNRSPSMGAAVHGHYACYISNILCSRASCII